MASSDAPPVGGGSASLGQGGEVIDAFACVVVAEWNARTLGEQLPTGLTPALAVEKDDMVWGFVVNQNYVYVRAYKNKVNLRGWVPTRVLIKGKKYTNPLPIELASRNRVAAIKLSAPSQSASTLQKALRCLWKTILDNKQEILQVLPGLSLKAQATLFNPSAINYADAIYNRILPQAKSIMDDGIFDPIELRNLRAIDASWPKNPGIYIWSYSSFGDRTVGSTVFRHASYVGQTIHFQNRKSGHESDARTNVKSNHYRIARQATQKTMVPILLQQDSQAPQNFLDIAEFSFVCLFQSWYPILLTPHNSNLIGAYASDFDAAGVFSRLMKRVCESTGWAPVQTLGVNWSTPIILSCDSNQQWISWYDEDEERLMFRSRRRVLKSPTTRGSKFDIHISGTECLVLPKELEKEGGFANYDIVHVVVEIRKRGNEYLPHPFRYVRMPTIGVNPELEKLRSMAIKIQWLPKGSTQWKQCYLDRSQIWLKFGTSPDEILAVYRKGLFILSDVEEISYSNGPGWLASRSPTPVYFLEYNHLEQKRIAKRKDVQVINWPRDNTMARNEARLREIFPKEQFPDVVIGAKPRRTFFNQPKRTSCDICLSQITTAKCQYDERDHSCQSCRSLNRPCTWTRSDRLMEDFVQEGRYEELAISTNVTRALGPAIRTMVVPPFDPDIESEEHAVLEK